MKTSLALLAAIVIGAAVSPGLQSAVARQRNVVLLVSDDQRPDTIQALGNPRIQTPNLDRLVATGTAFTRAVCPTPICVTSRAEILTGVNTFQNGMRYGDGRMKPELTTIGQAFQSAGYLTCYVGKWHTKGRPSDHGYTESIGLYSGGGGAWMDPEAKDVHGRAVTGYRGWIFQTDAGEKFPQRGVGLTPDISADFADAAIELIERKPDRPYFLHVNFTAPHDPLLPTPEFASRYAADELPLPGNYRQRHPFDHGNFDGRDEKLLPWPRTPADVRADLAAYYAVISHLDAQVGRILDALDESGQAENTIVLYTSDHGLAVGSHGLRGKQNMYEHTIGVPMLLRGPGVPAGQKLSAQVYLRDLYPTLCELSGVSIPESVQAKSMVPLLDGKAEQIHPEAYAYFRDVQRMVRTDRFKLIYYPHLDRWQLFDIVNDPLELTDLSAVPQYADQLAELQGKLQRWRKSVGDPLLAGE